MIQTNLFTKYKQTHRFREQIYGSREWGGGGRDRLGVWDWHVHTAVFKIDNQQKTNCIAQGILLNTLITSMRKNLEKE